MASGEKKRENNSWHTPDSKKKNIWQTEINREDDKKLEARIFGRTDKVYRKNSSSVFKIQEWQRETPPWIVEILRENEKQKGWYNNENDLKLILEKACD